MFTRLVGWFGGLFRASGDRFDETRPVIGVTLILLLVSIAALIAYFWKPSDATSLNAAAGALMAAGAAFAVGASQAKAAAASSAKASHLG